MRTLTPLALRILAELQRCPAGTLQLAARLDVTVLDIRCALSLPSLPVRFDPSVNAWRAGALGRNC